MSTQQTVDDPTRPSRPTVPRRRRLGLGPAGAARRPDQGRGSAGKKGKKRGGGAGAAFKLLWETSRPLTAAVVGYGVVASVAPVAVLVTLGILIQRIHTAQQQGLHGAAADSRILSALVPAGVAFVVTLLLGPVQAVLSNIVKWRLVYRTQDRLMTAVSRPVGTAHLEDPKVLDDLAMAQGKLVNYYSADAPMTLVAVLAKQINGALACLVLGWWHWWLGLLVLVAWVAILRPQLLLVKKQAAVVSLRTEMMRRAQYLEGLASKPAAARESRVFGLGGWLVDGYRKQWLTAMEGSWAVMRRQNRQAFTLAVFVLAVFAGVSVLLGLDAYHGRVDIGSVALLLSVLVASSGLGVLSMEDLRLPWMLQGLPRLAGLERGLVEEPAAGGGRPLGADTPAREIRFEQVAFGYPGADKPVFDGLDLTVPEGRATAVVGVNGAGKTTLVKLLARLHQPTGGRITVDGVDLAEYPARDWQRKVAVVFQDFERYPLSARENIALGSPEHATDGEGLEWAARQAGVLPVIEGLAQGWDTVLSREFSQGTDLSGGQWQRIVLARALFAVRHGARILVLDEPTAWLDARGEADFFDRFLDITTGATTMIISHRFSTVRRADQICVLEGGRVVESGDHDTLVARQGRYAELFALQAARFTEEDGE